MVDFVNVADWLCSIYLFFFITVEACEIKYPSRYLCVFKCCQGPQSGAAQKLQLMFFNFFIFLEKPIYHAQSWNSDDVPWLVRCYSSNVIRRNNVICPWNASSWKVRNGTLGYSNLQTDALTVRRLATSRVNKIILTIEKWLVHTKKILKERYKVRERYGLLNIVGTLRYRNADADVRTEERLGIEHCACQLCHRLTSASRQKPGFTSWPEREY